MNLTSLYWHFPYCKHLCNYCDFFKKELKGRDFQSLNDFYLTSWRKHSELMKENSFKWSPLKTFYMGGGTPSLWSEEGVKFLEKFIFSELSFDKSYEFTLEIDPGTWNENEYRLWKNIGVNRFSVGLQSLDPYFLSISDRAHDLEDSLRSLEILANHHENFSCDFLLSLPYSQEKKRDIVKELERLLEFNPKHISLYVLTVPKHYLHYQKLPSEDYSHDEYLKVSDFLTSHGFNHYEVSNFSLENFHSRNNYVYWQGRSFGAIGPSSTGFLSLSPEKALRYKWQTQKEDFQIEILGKEEMKLEAMYLSLRTSSGIALEHFSSESQEFFQTWVSRGVAEISHGQLRLTAKGYIVLDGLFDEIFSQKII